MIAEELTRLMRGLRDTRPEEFSGQGISQDVMDEILEAANLGAANGSTVPWRMKVYFGHGLQLLADILPRLYRVTTDRDEFKERISDQLGEDPLGASHVLAMIETEQPSGARVHVDPDEWAAFGVQNVRLAAYAHGVVSFWFQRPMLRTSYANKYFNLRDSERLHGLLFLGYPKNPLPDPARRPVSEPVEWIDP